MIEKPAEIKNQKPKRLGFEEINEGDLVTDNGQLFRAVKQDSGYTVREYYSHTTPTKGPGPGWDFKFRAFEQYGVNDVAELPDEPYYTIELIEVEK